MILYPLDSLMRMMGADKIATLPIGVLWTAVFIGYLLACAHIWRSALDAGLLLGGVHRHRLRGFRHDDRTSAAAERMTHIHILGIAGTFMGGVAAIAKGGRFSRHRVGFERVSADEHAASGPRHRVRAGYGAEQLDLKPDMVVVGNALSRGSPVIEAMLDRGMTYTSAPCGSPNRCSTRGT